MGDFNTPPELAGLIAELAARVSALERTRPIPTSATAPTSTTTDGALQGDESGPYLWLKIGGAWKRTAALV